MNAISTAMAHALHGATAEVATDPDVRAVVVALEPREGVLRRCGPQGAQRVQRRRPAPSATGHGSGVPQRARPPCARHRRRRGLRPGRRVRDRPLLRPGRGGRHGGAGAARGVRRGDPGGGRNAAGGASGRLVPGRRPRLHGAQGDGGRGLPSRSRRPARPGREGPARRLSHSPARSRRTRRSACAPPSGPCASAWRAPSRPGWRSRTRPGARSRSAGTGPRGSRPSPRSAHRGGPESDLQTRAEPVTGRAGHRSSRY